MPEVVTAEQLTAASRKGAAFARLLRPGTIRMPVLVFLAAGLGNSTGTAHVLGGVLLIVAAYGVATIVNDLADVEIDRANGRLDRPLVSGDLTATDARGALFSCAAGVVGAQLLLVQPLGLVVTAAAVAVALTYSSSTIALQSRGLWATAVLAGAYFVLPMLLSGARFDPLLVSAMTAGAMASLLYKDAKDEVGDRALGKRTPLVRRGAAWVDGVATLLGIGGIALGVAASGTGWWTVAAAAALALQLRIAVTGDHTRRPVVHQRLAALVALVLLAATA